MFWIKKRAPAEPLAVTMSGVKLGDRLLMVGSGDTPLVVALAGKTGLTGRACIVDESEEVSARNAAAIEQEGALIERFVAPFAKLPFDDGVFDVAALRNTLGPASADTQAALVREVGRALRPGGRCLVLDDAGRGGPGGEREREALAPLFESAGFRGLRLLAEREGLIFIEAVRPGLGQTD